MLGFFVGVNNGFVTLTGQAHDLAGRAAAQEQAVAVPKVRGVYNSINVPGVDIGDENQRTLQPVIGAGVYATDILIGVVEKVVVNPANRLVTAILANAVFPDPDQTGSNWLRNEHCYVERRIIIPIEKVRYQTSTSLFLKEKAAVVAGTNDFDPVSYVPAPDDWESPYPYKQEDVLLLRDE
jgi:BON domain-containing protein